MNLIIFDCDGTIADSQHMIIAAMEKAFAAQNLQPPAKSEVVGVIGLSLGLAVSKLLKLPNPHPDVVNDLTQGYKFAFRELIKDPANVEPLFEGAHEFILNLSARDDLVLGVATGKSTRGLLRLLEKENLLHHFQTLQTADDHPSKPHPAMIETAINEMGVKHQNTIMIGDTTFDVDMAKAAGIKAIAVTWGYHPLEELQQAGPNALVDNFESLALAIEEILLANCEATQ